MLHQVSHMASLPDATVYARQEIDELFKKVGILGTPDESTWSGKSKLADYKDTFPKSPPRPLAERVPTLEPLGVELLSMRLR